MFTKQFSKGLFLQVGIKFLAIGLGFFTTRWLVENLTSGQYRDYNLILAYNAVLLVLIDFGIPQTIQKIYTHSSSAIKNANFWTTITALRIFSYFFAIGLIYFTFPLSQTRDFGLILGLFTAQFIIVADLNYRSICQAVGRTWQFSLSDFIGKLVLVLGLVLGGILMYLKLAPLTYFVFLSILSYTVSIVIDAFWQRKYTKLGKFSIKQLKELSNGLVLLALSNLAIAVYLTTDKLFLAYFGYSDTTINGYSNAYKLFEIAQVVPGLVMPAISSLITKQLVQNITILEMKKILWKYIAFGLGLGSILWAGIMLFGKIIIWIIDSQNKYPDTGNILPILAISLIFICPMLIAKDTTIFLGYEKIDLLTTLLTAILAVTLYIILIPLYGGTGAALATIFSYLFDLLIKLFLLEKLLPKIKINRLITENIENNPLPPVQIL